jgi:hypothetical protein
LPEKGKAGIGTSDDHDARRLAPTDKVLKARTVGGEVFPAEVPKAGNQFCYVIHMFFISRAVQG